MSFERATLTKVELKTALSRACRRPHKDVHKGKLVISPLAYNGPERETNLCISPFAFLDCTGSIHIGPWCMLGPRSRVYTHDHIHAGRSRTLLETQEELGVLWQDKFLGADVWIHDGAMVLYQVTRIPDGVVVGASAVLTKNPGPYEIWAGVPARKVGERTDDAVELSAKAEAEKRFLLPESLIRAAKPGF
jgi:acetyltransferase-like isoleucine patch superfamily enzyme